MECSAQHTTSAEYHTNNHIFKYIKKKSYSGEYSLKTIIITFLLFPLTGPFLSVERNCKCATDHMI